MHYDSDLRRPRAIEEWLDLIRSGPLLRALVERNIKIRYKRSVLGLFWSIANPVPMLLMVSLVLGRLLSKYAPAYPLFACAGLLPWTFFSQTTTVVTSEVAGGIDLWRRTRIPKTALALATVMTNLFNLLMTLVPLIGILLIAGRPIGVALLSLVPTLILTSVFAFGAALLLSTVALAFPDIADLYAMLLPTLMFTSTVIYPDAIVPAPIRSLLPLNPLTTFIEAFRAPLYANAWPTAGAWLVMTIVSFVTAAAGWLLFNRSAHDVIAHA
ncbi:MAG TPA: ABC transporter permease [Thermoanaerobaculia bacterium]|nr:ABC transporter permease [Thermoanaerobaculia bacterium]